ncbi:MAG: corrinoid protein, partial [Alphaproteobacteria bacterium]|nr:corrinoid protein [Alphaproteobacteria bacterium]
GLVRGMDVVAQKWKEGEVFVPEVLRSAKTMQLGMNILKPLLGEDALKPKGVFAIGTVKGDLHDIGKNLCIMMLRGSGFEVVDLGVDTSEDEFIDAIEEHQAGILGMSALLTTTMPNMAKTIEALIDADVRDDVMIMVGGAPVTQEFADDMGADGYGKDALSCVSLARKLAGEKV